MRISTDRDDPGFREDATAFTVLFDGEPQSPGQTGRAIVTADEALGLIRYHPCAADGTVMMFGDFGCTVTEEAHGRVSIFRFL